MAASLSSCLWECRSLEAHEFTKSDSQVPRIGFNNTLKSDTAVPHSQALIGCPAQAHQVTTLVHVRRVQFIEKPLALGHQDFDSLWDQNLWRQDAGRFHSNCEEKNTEGAHQLRVLFQENSLLYQHDTNELHSRTDEMVSHSPKLHHVLQIVMSEDFSAARIQATVHDFSNFSPLRCKKQVESFDLLSSGSHIKINTTETMIGLRIYNVNIWLLCFNLYLLSYLTVNMAVCGVKSLPWCENSSHHLRPVGL